MSIPKEPRQLMINLMYLVLTAMLALNVSAEIINAFFSLNKGIKDSNEIVAGSNASMKDAIDEQVKVNPAKNGPFRDQATKVISITKDFESYVNDLTSQLITKAGGLDPKHSDGRPVKYKDKDIPNQIFLAGGKGAELEAKIKATRDALLSTITDPAKRADLTKKIALQVDSIPLGSEAKTWVDLKFAHMPVAAVMPTLTKCIADAKTSETALLNYFMDEVSGKKEIKFDRFKVAIAPKKAYLIRGDKFEADVYLAAFSSNPGQDVSISVNGSGLGLKEGVAHYETTPSSIGKQTVKASASIRNPATGQVTSTTGEFEYEVGEKSATISAEKMNVFYIGVTNPIAVSAAGISSNSLKVSGSGCSVSRVDANNYNVTATSPGEAIITVSGEGGFTATKKFRVKLIPDPVAKYGAGKASKGGVIGSGEMAAFNGIRAELENFDFDAKCSIQSYVMVHVPKREDPRQANVTGAISGEATRLTSSAKPGDTYNIMNIKGRCPGDQIARDLGSMTFFVR
jgi:gliding motility-associated protein GldM